MKKLLALFIILLLVQPACFAAKKKKEKKKEKLPPMVHTVEEWEEAATSLKMDMRKRPEDISIDDKKYLPPEDKPAFIEKYNTKPGSRELNLSLLYTTQNVRTPYITDSAFKNAVYTQIYYYPQTRQVASTLYLLETDDWLDDKEKLKDLSIFEHTNYPLISTALTSMREGFFDTLTVVDFSNDGKKILVKERRGSNKHGLYETFAWIYFLSDENKEENECYNNNLSFNDDFITFEETLQGDEQPVKGMPNVPRTTSQKPDTDNLKDVPVIGLDSINDGVLGAYKKEETEKETIIDTTPKLTYEDLNSYIKSVWKNSPSQEKETKERWYNKKLEGPMAEIPYNVKEKKGFGVRLNLLNETIKAYWLDRKNLILNYIRWDLNPLGFNASNSDEIIVKAYAYDKEGKKVSLGDWAVNINDGLPRLINEDENIEIESNALFLQEKLNRRN